MEADSQAGQRVLSTVVQGTRRTCPVCHGSGQVSEERVWVSRGLDGGVLNSVSVVGVRACCRCHKPWVGDAVKGRRG